ncbi:unnamed protein product (macronuclear) [Paramecium tetraurelia]|uniref:Uncharacterized protein n=1 Tax=Paramecium tetraurelia TaxID=5888 RepID=A0C2R4_PARTE|nr:uncharacterized protein GSPATT00034559001 [Paramecium tetraurelia]CAK65081.1 unnamed protein product [Paramecium tetraurelia]|eukprot:XP_001432478.1 hypothetical protein (macronuclear) [Paramecium tetraurelia strain d4-2]
MRHFNANKKRSGSIQCIEPDVLINDNRKSRRKSCTCTQCGKNSEFQIRFHDVQISQLSETSNNNELIIQQEQETRKLESLLNRLKTCQEDFEKIDLQTKKRRKSCYCSECGSLTQYELKNQSIPLLKINYLNDCKTQRKVHKFVSNINMQTKSQFFRSFKQQNPSLMYQFSHQTSKTTTRLLKQSKLKLSNLETRLSLTPQLIISPRSDQSTPKQSQRLKSFDHTLNGANLNPYLGFPKKFLSPPKNLVPKLPPIAYKVSNDLLHLKKSLYRKRN